MVLNFDYEAYFDELKATKPPYKCPFKDCEKVYKTYSGMHFHVINTHKSGSTGDGRSTTSARWHHRQSKSPMTPPKSVSSIENVSLEDINDRYQQSDGEQHDHGKIKCKVKINDKLHKIKDSDKLLVTVSQRSDSSIMDATTNYSLKSSDRTYVEQGSHVEESILKETPKKPTPTPSFRLIKDYYDSPIIHSKFQMPFKDYITFKSPLNGSENENTDYCLDEEDRTWLKMNEAHCRIDETKFETLIDKLEKASYFVTRGEAKLQQHNNSLMSSSLHATCNKPVDDNALCSICYDGSCTSNNTILFCDMCDMGVHQECYGVPYVPEGVWLCRRCLHSPSKELQCCLCPSPGGVLKQTVDGRWAHILCAAWVPEVHFANPVFLEPIDGLDTIPPARWRLMCFLCRRRRVGACIQCHRPNCYTAFHVSCALYAGLHLKMRSRSGSSTFSGIFLSNHSIGNVKKSAYCDIHKPMLKLDGHDNDEEDDSEVDGVDIADNDDEYEPMSKAKTEMVMRKRSEMTKAVMLKMKRVVQVLSYPTMPNSW
ncbi:hypothetical protein HELRODRAFT_83056 [Helobdella robusta]|uniref:PHD-type domain-containing protein n=1 Tax=Helobdella robusta TaxID=6412 RepID=T1G4Z7_HELRO|nr:hypothetical protein HELRODRAFT_83056 [Helobdella robusta]ESO00368.1 hypothetical protein HELRODRAFT_83056 [Helobdella robusta]